MLRSRRSALPLLAFILAIASTVSSQSHQSFDSRAAQTTPASLEHEVRVDMPFPADDALHGRGSATRDEHIAALFAASQLQSLGLEPGAPEGSFIQKSPLPDPLPQRLQQRVSKFEETSRQETWNAVAI